MKRREEAIGRFCSVRACALIFPLCSQPTKLKCYHPLRKSPSSQHRSDLRCGSLCLHEKKINQQTKGNRQKKRSVVEKGNVVISVKRNPFSVRATRPRDASRCSLDLQKNAKIETLNSHSVETRSVQPK